MVIRIQLFGGRRACSGGNYFGTSKPPAKYHPNSSYTWNKNGKPYQKRWYDSNGTPKLDKDFTNHGNPKKHPVTPHYHDWNNGERGKGYWKDSNGTKHYF